MGIKEAFNKNASDYDKARQQLIPCYTDFYATALEIIETLGSNAESILDLGAGTGLLSSLVAPIYPQAEYTLCDISEKMLTEAKKRFAGSPLVIRYVYENYATASISRQYDLVISSLSIHHLTGEEKQALFAQIFNSLSTNGLFVNADQVLGETAMAEQIYRDIWLRQVKEKGVSDEALSAALFRMEEDKMSTLSEQLAWLANAGFSEVHCWYQHFSFVVYSARKISPANGQAS